MSSEGSVVVCPFSSAVGFCDKFVSGVPVCVVENSYPDLSYEELVAEMKAKDAGVPLRKVIGCSHFVRSDVYLASFSVFKKSECFFGGSCVYPAAQGYGACSVDCSRWKSANK